MTNMQNLDFNTRKAKRLGKKDESRKGSVDSLIADLVDFINKQAGYFTTSSCSGRIVVLSDNEGTPNPDHQQTGESASKKKGCQWHLISHDPVSATAVIDCLKSMGQLSKLKFEAFILHVNCRDLKVATLMQNAALSSGFRNSGITIGKHGRNLQVAVRGTMGLEVPLTDMDGHRITTDQYIEHVVGLANMKLCENERRIQRFNNCLKDLLKLENDKTATFKPGKPERLAASNGLKVVGTTYTDIDHPMQDICKMFSNLDH